MNYAPPAGIHLRFCCVCLYICVGEVAHVPGGRYEALELQVLRKLDVERHSPRHRAFKCRIVCVRWFWLLLSGVIALFIPHFGDYLGLIGALATSLAIYILPHLCWLKECRRTASTPHVLLSCAVVAFGAVLAVWGTQQSVAGLLKPAPRGAAAHTGGSGSGLVQY